MSLTAWILALLGLVAVAILSLSLYARMRPLDPARFHRTFETRAPGDWPEQGGFEAVRATGDGPDALARLVRVIEGTPRTTRLAGSVAEGHASFVTRSRLMGFPDVTNVWLSDGAVRLRGHLVIGGSDLGVNEARIRGWLQAAELL